MMKVLIAAGMPMDKPELIYDKVIGVDRGNIHLIEHGIVPDVSVGDFDSVNADEFKKISSLTKKLIQLPAEKDETDLEVALDYAITHFPEAKIEILGALGGRLDHHLANVYLPTTEKYRAFSSQISMLDQQNEVLYLSPGKHELIKKSGKKYIGFVQINTGRSLEIQGAKYPLKAEDNFADIYGSNEFISDKMTVSFDKGMVMVVYTSDMR